MFVRANGFCADVSNLIKVICAQRENTHAVNVITQ
jgi:hypothetical protein